MPGAALSGSGTVTGVIADDGTIKASGGLLTQPGTVGRLVMNENNASEHRPQCRSKR
jgi:hypothetical protein